jgi:filamentous hemagglutinin family protein
VFKALSSWFGLSLCTLGYLGAANNPALAEARLALGEETSPSFLAQVTSDGTVNTQVTENGNTAEITEGETRGDNLFHSFEDFSVETGNEAFFNNADSISNIFSRVTGGNVSDINGAIRANGSANLFLINPAGIIFGEGASLNIGGSFYGSSASSILFKDGEFSAADLENPPLLTVNAPIGLGFRDEPGDIINRSNFGLTSRVIDETINPAFAGAEFTILESVGLAVNPDQTIALVGGNVLLENAAGITALGGRVELGGLTQAGEVLINDNGSLTFPQGISRGDVTLTEQSRVITAAAGGGFININAKNLELSGLSELYTGIAEDSGAPDAQTGDININATDSVKLIGSGGLEDNPFVFEGNDYDTGIRNFVGLKPNSSEDPNLGRNLKPNSTAIGNAGLITINTDLLQISDRAAVVAKTYGQGDTDNITILADTIQLDGGDFLNQVRREAVGNAGDINIQVKSFSAENLTFVISDVEGKGDAGDITINAQENVFLGLDTLVITQIQPDGEGSGGDIEINTKDLNLLDASLLSDSKGVGDAGSIRINASNSILLQDAPDTEDSVFKQGSSIISGVGILGDETTGNAGNIEINTKSLTSEGSSFIVAQTNGVGDGGNIAINSQESVFLNDTSRIVSQVQEKAVGDGGGINVTSPIISLNGLSAISTTTLAGGKGVAGDINLNTDNLTLTDTSIIDALTQNNFDGGDITISASNLNLIGGSKIVTATDGAGNAGNITLDVDKTINISGNNPEFNQFIAELTQDEMIRENEASETEPNDRFRFTTPSSILQVLGGSSGLFANTSIKSTGDAGNIEIGNPQEFSLAETALISVGSQGDGGAGSLSIEAQSLSLNNGSLLAATPSGVGGNITLSIADNLILDNQSLVSAQATENADGGNINIDSRYIIAYPNGNNDILANAERGTGGNININAESLFGIEERTPSNATNDINASSEFNLDGTVNINNSRIDPLQGAKELPSNVVEAKQTTAQTCSANREGKANNGLAIAGRGGITPAPDAPLNSENISNENPAKASIPEPIETAQGKIQPARGIMVTKSGRIILTAYRTNNAGERIPEIKPNCN